MKSIAEVELSIMTSAASSTFQLARAAAEWAKEIDPNTKFSAEDLLPLVGSAPVKKLLGWCQNSWRNKDKIRSVVRNRESERRSAQTEELTRLSNIFDSKTTEVNELLTKQRELNTAINKVLESIRNIENKVDREKDDFATLQTRHQIFLELEDKRDKDLKLWVSTLIEVNNQTRMIELERNIVAMKDLSHAAVANASSAVTLSVKDAEKTTKKSTVLGSSSTSIRQGTVGTNNQQTTNSGQHSSGAILNEKGASSMGGDVMTAGTYKQSHAEIQAHILREYLTACTVMHSVNAKHSEKMLVAEEQKDHFKNALAVEVALAEQICLRTLTKEIEEAVLQVSKGPTELIRQQQRSQQLRDTANQLKKKIAMQARKNVLLDKKLEEINRFIFEGDVFSFLLFRSFLTIFF